MASPVSMLGRIKAAWFLLRDPATPLTAKAGIVVVAGGFGLLMIAYGLSPIDLMPDVVLPVGLIDDLIVIPLLFWLLTRFMPARVADRVLRRFGRARRKVGDSVNRES